MSKATLTMIGMYRWDSNLFKNLILPAGVDRDTEINTILLQSGEFEVLYSDFDFMEEMIGVISKKWQRTFQKWYDALQLEYNPIENYDRYETWTDTGTNTGTVKHGISKNSTSTASETSKGSNSENVKGSNSETITGSNSENTTGSSTESVKGSSTESVKGSSSDNSSSSSTTDTLVSTYDSDSLHEDNQSKSSQTATSSGTTSQDTTDSSTQDTTSSSKQDTSGSNKQTTTGSSDQNSIGSDQRSTNSSGSVSEYGSDDETRNLGTSGQHEGHLHGNIGVTTSQTMLKQELNIDAWNLYEHIADVFVRELCIPVY